MIRLFDIGKLGLALLALFVVACSDTSVSDKSERGMGIVASVEDLPPCSAENEGESFFVKSEGGMRVCSDANWFAVMDGSTSCHTEELPDKSGLKIICGNDSVGVVLNGAKGDNGLSGQGCSVTRRSADSLWIKCGTTTFAMPFSNSDVLDSERIATSLEGVGGFTQKGPFLMGSEVNVIELKDGRTLDQTGDNFETVILNDSGFFKLNARMMMSQYLELHAKGYYRNEVSGQNSTAPLTLYAVTDVMMRDGGLVNINLLTHLEYHRVVYLVKREKKKVAAAKDQAEREIFKILDIAADDFASSEDLNIAGSTEGDAALLAFSVMLQGDRDVARLSVLLTNISAEMEKDGVWNDTTMRDSIADWAEKTDATGRLDTIRSHVESWGLSAKVPNFEKYVRHFWTTAYGLGECGKNNLGKIVAANTKRLENSLERYICVDSTGIGYMWRRASEVEKDTHGWTAATDGFVKNGDFTGNPYIYDSIAWRLADSVEAQVQGCTGSRDGEVSSMAISGNYFICRNRVWNVASVLEYDTYDPHNPNPVDGAMKHGRVNDTITYIFDSLGVGWREATDLEKQYGPCIASVETDSDRNTYLNDEWCRCGSFGCQASGSVGTFMVCINRQWEGRGLFFVETRYYRTDVEDGTVQKGNYSNIIYVFSIDNGVGRWRTGWPIDAELGIGCTNSNYGETMVKDNITYSCTDVQPDPMGRINGPNGCYISNGVSYGGGIMINGCSFPAGIGGECTTLKWQEVDDD